MTETIPNWPTAVVVVAMVISAAFVFSVFYTGRWPWDKR